MHGFEVKRLAADEISPWAAELTEKRAAGLLDYRQPVAIPVLVIDGRTASGRPSVAMKFTLPDGKVLVVETTAGAVLMLAAAIRGWYGDPIPAPGRGG